MDVSLILFDGEISIVNSGDDFWEMLLEVFTVPSSSLNIWLNGVRVSLSWC